MDGPLNYLRIFFLFGGLAMSIFSLYVIGREIWLARRQSAPDVKKLPWYANEKLRNSSEQLLNGLFLALFMVLVQPLVDQDSPAIIWGAVVLFLYSGFRLAFALIQEIGQRRAAREEGKKWPFWPSSLDFHIGIAAAAFWLGVGILTLLIGQTAVQAEPYQVVSEHDNLWKGLIIGGGSYWLLARLISLLPFAITFYKSRKARSAASPKATQ
ncbi:MAG TPA: hypothetical protein VFN35_00350 [Ktedonobacteraceae bacterium]|nr:hypothetical protein [Ktedonobacteraceae bacterium]